MTIIKGISLLISLTILIFSTGGNSEEMRNASCLDAVEKTVRGNKFESNISTSNADFKLATELVNAVRFIMNSKAGGMKYSSDSHYRLAVAEAVEEVNSKMAYLKYETRHFAVRGLDVFKLIENIAHPEQRNLGTATVDSERVKFLKVIRYIGKDKDPTVTVQGFYRQSIEIQLTEKLLKSEGSIDKILPEFYATAFQYAIEDDFTPSELITCKREISEARQRWLTKMQALQPGNLAPLGYKSNLGQATAGSAAAH